jgi:hypothetical protein
MYVKDYGHLNISKWTPKTQSSHTYKQWDGVLGGDLFFCFDGLRFLGSEVPGIKRLFVTAVGWPK